MSQPQGTEVGLGWGYRLYPGWGVFKGGYWAVPKPFYAQILTAVLAANARGGIPDNVYPDSSYRNSLFIELGQVVGKRVWVSPLECTEVIKGYEYH